MNADSFDGLLDLDSFTKDFESGKLDHLLSEKEKSKKIPKKLTPVKQSFADVRPEEIIEFIEVITCECCKAEYKFLKGFGLKTYLKNSSCIAAVNKINELDFLNLKEAEKFGTPYITTVAYESCNNCHKFHDTTKEVNNEQ